MGDPMPTNTETYRQVVRGLKLNPVRDWVRNTEVFTNQIFLAAFGLCELLKGVENGIGLLRGN